MPWPITFADVLAARDRIRPHLAPTPLRSYAALDAAVGGAIRVLVKHENHCPTGAFKARNGLAVMTSLSAEERRRGVVAATRGNHGAGLAWAGQIVGVPVTVCVPRGNNPEKNEAMRGFGAELVEEGRDYDEAVEVADRLVRERGLRLVHSSNEPQVLAGAARSPRPCGCSGARRTTCRKARERRASPASSRCVRSSRARPWPS